MVDEDGEEVIGGHEDGQGSQHLAPGTPRAEVEQHTAHRGEVEPFRVGRSREGQTAEHGDEQEQVCGHGNLNLFNFREKLPGAGTEKSKFKERGLLPGHLQHHYIHSGTRRLTGQPQRLDLVNNSFEQAEISA